MANTKRPASSKALEGRVVGEDEAWDFDLDGILQQEATKPAFRFPLEGTIYELPNASRLSIRQSERMEDDAEGVLADIADAETADKLVNLPGGALAKLMDAWMSHAGLGGGKSRGSRRS